MITLADLDRLEALRDVIERDVAIEQHGLLVRGDALKSELYSTLYRHEAELIALARQALQPTDVARLRKALEWFADSGHYTDTYRRGAGYVDALGENVAQAALGMHPDDCDCHGCEMFDYELKDLP